MNAPIIVVGAGGHACVVADALIAAGEHVLGFTAADPARHGAGPCALPALGDGAVLDAHNMNDLRLANGIGGTAEPGDPMLRQTVQQRLEAREWRFAAVRNPNATVSRFAALGNATQLLAGSIVQAGARVGDGCIVNTGAIVEHDVDSGDWTHVAPRALLRGQVTVGSHCHVGAGAVVRQGVRRAKCTVGRAGAVVLADAPCGGVFVGVRARRRGETQ